LSGNSKGGNTIAAVWKIVEPYAKELELEIWDIQFVKEGATHYLRIFIDREGEVGIDDCVNLSHAIDKPLDDEDPIENSYCLEVSSPGLQRALTRPQHFEKLKGQKIRIKTIRAVEGTREFCGTLCGYDNGEITIVQESDEVKIFNKKDTAWVRLDDFEDSNLPR
jgi:ribosome maturation factor RimP